jgi:23S rRNA-/tRNA-specific pseudouridylate synthase
LDKKSFSKSGTILYLIFPRCAMTTTMMRAFAVLSSTALRRRRRRSAMTTTTASFSSARLCNNARRPDDITSSSVSSSSSTVNSAELKLPARVEHCDVVVAARTKLSAALHREIADVEELYFQRLIFEFGAVYISDPLEENFKLEANAVRHKMKRVTSDVVLPAASRHYVRCHIHPRRFPVASTTRWKDRLLKETEDFVVVMKPSGLPVAASVDNAKENVLRCVSSALTNKDAGDGDSAKLFPTHRLDVTTSGVLVVAKTGKAAGIFSKILRDGLVEKRYLALTENGPAKVGLMTHEFEPSERTIGKGARTVTMKNLELSKDDIDLYLKDKTQIPSNVAMLRVEKSEKVQIDGKMFYESTIELITGRTHQIRAQFSKENLALVNDCLYTNTNSSDEIAFPPPPPPRVPEPEELIGLHALSLKINADTSLGPKGVEFRAGNEDIWWRQLSNK